MPNSRYRRLSFMTAIYAMMIGPLASSAMGATIGKRDNTNLLRRGESWFAAAPGTNDIGLFDSRFSGGMDLDTGGAISWYGIRVTNPSKGMVKIRNAGSQYLGIRAGGVDLSQATRKLRVDSFAVQANHTWNVVSGFEFVVGATAFSQGGYAVSLTNGGTVTFLGSGLTLGNSSSFTGTLAAGSAGLSLYAGSGASYSIGGSTTTTSTLTKSGNGLYTVGGTNTFAGGVRLTAGTLALASSQAIGTSGTITFLGGALRFTSANRGDYSPRYSTANGQAIKLDTNGQSVTHATALRGSGSTITKLGSGTLTLSATNTYTGGTAVSGGTLNITGRLGNGSYAGSIANAGALVFNQSSNQILSGAISGAGSLTKTGSGTLTLASTSNSWTGGTTISGGTLATSGANRLPANRAVTVNTGATLTLNGSQSLSSLTGSGTVSIASGTLTVGSATSSFSGSLKGAGNLSKTGNGTLTLAGASSLFTGAVTVSGGTLVLDNDAALSESVDLTVSSNATLTIQAGHTVTVNSFVLESGTVSGAGSIEALTTEVHAATVDKPIKNARGRRSNFVKRGSGITRIRAANTFTGTLDITEGTIQLDNGGSFSHETSLALTSGSTLDLNGKNQTFSAIDGAAGTVSLGAGTLTIGDSGAFGGGISGTGSLQKEGSGDLVLSGTSTYSGTTTVSAGRLSINGVLQNTAVTVAGGELGGAGSLQGSLAIAAGATLAPGNSIESLTAGPTTFAADATFHYEVDSSDLDNLGTAADLLVVNGDLAITPGTLLTFVDIGSQPGEFQQDTTVFALINYTGSWDGGTFTVNDTALADDSQFFVDDQMWQIDYNATAGGLNFTADYQSGSFVTVTAVPEPSTGLMLLVAAAGGVAAAARRKAAGRQTLVGRSTLSI